MDDYSATFFEDVTQEISLISLPPLTHPDMLQQTEFLDYEIKRVESLALEKLHRQQVLENMSLCVYLVKIFCLKKS